jgi:hypothetical protein
MVCLQDCCRDRPRLAVEAAAKYGDEGYRPLGEALCRERQARGSLSHSTRRVGVSAVTTCKAARGEALERRGASLGATVRPRSPLVGTPRIETTRRHAET